MIKKSVSQNIFSVTTKNSNWEILTQNLVTLNDKIVLRIKIFNLIFLVGVGGGGGVGVKEKINF